MISLVFSSCQRTIRRFHGYCKSRAVLDDFIQPSRHSFAKFLLRELVQRRIRIDVADSSVLCWFVDKGLAIASKVDPKIIGD